MEKLSNIFVSTLMVVLLAAVFGSEVCLPEGKLYCRLTDVPSFPSAEIYYQLLDGTKCPAGCRFPILPIGPTCPDVPTSRRRALSRRQFLLPVECRQIYQLYADINGTQCPIMETYTIVCLNELL